MTEETKGSAAEATRLFPYERKAKASDAGWGDNRGLNDFPRRLAAHLTGVARGKRRRSGSTMPTVPLIAGKGRQM